MRVLEVTPAQWCGVTGVTRPDFHLHPICFGGNTGNAGNSLYSCGFARYQKRYQCGNSGNSHGGYWGWPVDNLYQDQK